MFSSCVRRFSPGTPASSHRTKNMHFSLIGGSILALGVSVHGRLSRCGPVMDWRPLQSSPATHPMTAGMTDQLK